MQDKNRKESNKLSISQRIKAFLDEEGITVAAFERSIGASNGSIASQLKNNGNIGADRIESILLKYSNINPFWLLTGKGEMLITEMQNSTIGNIDNSGVMGNTHIGSGNSINITLPDYGTQKIIKSDGTIEVIKECSEAKGNLVAEGQLTYRSNTENLQEQIRYMQDQVNSYKEIIEQQKEIIKLLRDVSK